MKITLLYFINEDNNYYISYCLPDAVVWTLGLRVLDVYPCPCPALK